MIKRIILVLLCGFLITSCGNSKTNNDGITVENVNYSAKTAGYSNIEELENDADVIVKVRRLDKEEPKYKYTEEAKSYTIAFTFSEVEVEKIYKGMELVSEGETIKILENDCTIKEDNKRIHIAGYSMMKVDKEYLLFLRKRESLGIEHFVSLGINYGTVSLEEDDRYNEKDGKGEYILKRESLEKYENIWNDVKDKYNY